MALPLGEVLQTGSVLSPLERRIIDDVASFETAEKARRRRTLNISIGSGVIILVAGGHDPHREPFSRNPGDTIVLGYN